MYIGNISHVGYNNDVRRLESVHRLIFFDFVLYYIAM